MTNIHRNHLSIDLKKLKQNFHLINEHVKPLKVMAVLKADAYGLGLERISQALIEENVDSFGVAELSEALKIIELKKPIYILGDILEEEIPLIVEHQIIPPVNTFEKAKLLNDEAKGKGIKLPIQFLIDTGMGRLGTPIIKAKEFILSCRQFSHLQFHGIYSHFPHAYEDQEFSQKQITAFLELVDELKQENISFEEIHIANSDGIQNIHDASQFPFTMVRTGINLYGCFDLEGQRVLDLQEIISLQSRLIAIRQLTAGDSVGYGRSYTLEKDSLIGTVSIGYADGLPLSLSASGVMIINGHRCPIIGRVSMDYTTVLLPNNSVFEVGDNVMCLGEDTSVSDWAHSKKTITYEIICALSPRIQRLYLD